MDAAEVEAEAKDEEQPLLRHSREYTLVTEDAEATDGRWISEIRRYAACSPRSTPSLAAAVAAAAATAAADAAAAAADADAFMWHALPSLP
jgi:hypothetical protein